MGYTEQLMNKMIKIMNTSKGCQNLMKELMNDANKAGLSEKEWEDFKQHLFFGVFVQLIQEHEDIKKECAKDFLKEFNLYEELRRA